MKIYDLDTLVNALYDDLVWRQREISDLKQVNRITDSSFKKTVLRASLPLIYAHWEGHIKFCASAYVSFVASKRAALGTLQYGYSLAELRPRLDRLISKYWLKTAQIDFLQDLGSIEKARFGKSGEQIVDTRSNLSMEVLREIGLVIGLDISSFEDEGSFIDKALLDRRNHIAHGRELPIEEKDFEDVADRTIALMRMFNSAIQYAALEEKFRRAA